MLIAWSLIISGNSGVNTNRPTPIEAASPAAPANATPCPAAHRPRTTSVMSATVLVAVVDRKCLVNIADNLDAWISRCVTCGHSSR
ncbi:hypothetical protein GCM10009619_05100 [Williamsia maris]